MKLSMINQPESQLITTQEASKKGVWQTLVVVAVLLLVGYLAYGLFFAPALFMDDWTSVVERVITDNAHWLDMTQRRPLLFSTFLLQYHLLDLNITAYYISLWLLYILMAFLLYAIISRLPLPYPNLFGLITAVLFLIFPTNYTHMWLIMFGVYCATALTLLYAYLLLRFAQGGSWFSYFLALICALLPLGVYEGQIGIASVWACILFVIYFRQNTTIRRVSLLIPVFLMAIYALWRTFGYQAAGVEDKYLSQVATSPLVLLSRLLLGYKITLGWGWTAALAEFLPWASSAKLAVITLVGTVVILWAVFWLVLRVQSKNKIFNNDPWSLQARWTKIMPYLITTICGILLIAAGYVPTISVFLPSLSGIGSRFNIFATVGGSVTVASFLMIGSILIANYAGQVKYFFLIAAAPIILVGIFANASVQYHNKIAWQEQQTIWEELFVAAPDLKDDTFVLFILPGFENRTGFINWKRTPLSASWEASSGVRLLYDNPTLQADVYFPNIDEPIEPILTREGVLTQESTTVTPYPKVAAFIYDNNAKTLLRLKELPPHYMSESDEPVQLCSNCIVQDSDVKVPYRELLLD